MKCVYYITSIEILERLFYYTFAELLWNTDESFEKRSVLFKAKEGENFNHPREIGFAFHGAGTNTWSILRINPPKFGGGLKYEPDAGIGQKGAFCKALRVRMLHRPDTLL